MADDQHIVALNGGSSTIKFAVFRGGATLERLLAGAVDRIGSDRAVLVFSRHDSASTKPARIAVPAGVSASTFLLDWLLSQPVFGSARIVGHRIVHGMQRSAPAVVTAQLLQELRQIQPFAPEHLPLEIELVEQLARRRPDLLQVCCFDTAFHCDMPPVAKQLALPRRFEQAGLRRYGFHGLSYSSLMEQLTQQRDPAASAGRLILAHLGNGSSMAAVRDGRSIDTSMGLTPASGLVMGTRSGDVDPGLFGILSRLKQMPVDQLDRMLGHDCGLLGVSQLSSDVRVLLATEAHNAGAAAALALYCYQAKKCIGAYAAALGGLDVLVFTGGIGENAPLIRERICAGLGFLGVHLDPLRNAEGAAIVSPDGAPVRLRVIRTDEELVIARSCAGMMATA